MTYKRIFEDSMLRKDVSGLQRRFGRMCDVGRILKVTIISVHFKNKTAS
jgi:hypothetical protein